MKFRSVVPSFVLAVFGIFLIVGIAVLSDYGIWTDEINQRNLAILTADYIVGNNDYLFQSHDRSYGVAFEMLLLCVERILVLEDSRSIYLSRHFLTHLFFLIGGLACYFLAYRLFNNRFLALFAMLLFLLHPRMYAHSFSNSKDIPFLSMFMVTLFLIFRGFRKDTIGAFLLCGTGIGILTNIRIMGIMLFAAVLFMRVCDYFFASGREEKKHILVTGGGFAFVAVLALYATWPYLWSDPIGRFIESFTVMSSFSHYTLDYFQGELFSSLNPPFNYIPTWISITTPPVTFLLGIIGMISFFGRGFIHPRDILHNTQLRFGFLLVACFMLPILAVVMLNSTLYHGWRQMYFLYAPFCVLAVFGLHELVTYSKRIRFGERIVYGLAGTGIIATVVSMMILHPFQNLYFNFLVDRSTPEHLKREYYMGDWGTGALTALKHLIEQYPSSSIHIDTRLAWEPSSMDRNRMMLPKYDRKRIIPGINPDQNNDYFSYINDSFYAFNVRKNALPGPYYPSLIHKYQIYNNTVFSLVKLTAYESHHRAMAMAHNTQTLQMVLPVTDAGVTSLIRIINNSPLAGVVRIHATDDAGERFGPVAIYLPENGAVNFTSQHLEQGHFAHGLSGTGDGVGNWRLELDSSLNFVALAYIRTSDGFLADMYDKVPETAETHHVAFFNPASNMSKQSRLRLVNPGTTVADVTISARDDEGVCAPGGSVTLTIPAGASQILTAQALEAGEQGFTGSFGNGIGKWRLFVTSSAPIEVMNLLSTASGEGERLADLSTMLFDADADNCRETSDP